MQALILSSPLNGRLEGWPRTRSLWPATSPHGACGYPSSFDKLRKQKFRISLNSGHFSVGDAFFTLALQRVMLNSLFGTEQGIQVA
jgi:hypothetical protein